MTILAVGDVCGEIGIRCIEENLRAVRKEFGADFCVVNGENADVMGIKPAQAWRLYDAGADIVSLGNHIWNRMQIMSELDEAPFLVRPLNLGPYVPGCGVRVTELADGRRVRVINLIGRFNCEWNAASPFEALDAELKNNGGEFAFTAVDFHAEATSEKAALAHHADGRLSAVFGTHTHVQTSDARVLPGGTGFITDIGMTGGAHTILGVLPEQSVSRFLGKPPQSYRSPEDGPCLLEGAVFRLDDGTGKCLSATSFRREFTVISSRNR